MKPRSNVVLVGLIASVFCAPLHAGCKKEAKEPAPEPTTGAETTEPEQDPDAKSLSEGPCQLPVVYFAFDSPELDADARAAIQESVDCYRGQQRELRLLLIGACDPRGTEEYNIALGERRASAVRNYMKLLGADASQVSVTSVGEEVATGTDEASWAKDRNVTATDR